MTNVKARACKRGAFCHLMTQVYQSAIPTEHCGFAQISPVFLAQASPFKRGPPGTWSYSQHSLHQRHELRTKSCLITEESGGRGARSQPGLSQSSQCRAAEWKVLGFSLKIQEAGRCSYMCAHSVPLISAGMQSQSVQQTCIQHLLRAQQCIIRAHTLLWR